MKKEKSPSGDFSFSYFFDFYFLRFFMFKSSAKMSKSALQTLVMGKYSCFLLVLILDFIFLF